MPLTKLFNCAIAAAVTEEQRLGGLAGRPPAAAAAAKLLDTAGPQAGTLAARLSALLAVVPHVGVDLEPL